MLLSPSYSDHVQNLVEFVRKHQPIFVLTGAGCSTGSGLADYRNRQGDWKRPQPITGATFLNNEMARKRYWARSTAGWPVFAVAQPNTAHLALAQLQASGYLSRLVTQNVDGLHQKAGHRDVIDLHGQLATVTCQSCARQNSRNSFQAQLLDLNPWLSQNAEQYAPDGDAVLPDGIESALSVPECDCGGIFKPDVVFFGENVAKTTVADAMDSLKHSKALLVAGSSLMVFSGYRFCRRAAELGLPIASVNFGVTRGDELLSLKIQADCGATLNQLARELS